MRRPRVPIRLFEARTQGLYGHARTLAAARDWQTARRLIDERLAAAGLWPLDRDDQMREIILREGEATLLTNGDV